MTLPEYIVIHVCEDRFGQQKLTDCERCAEIRLLDRITDHLREWQDEAKAERKKVTRISFSTALEAEASWLESVISSIRAKFR